MKAHDPMRKEPKRGLWLATAHEPLPVGSDTLEPGQTIILNLGGARMLVVGAAESEPVGWGLLPDRKPAE